MAVHEIDPKTVDTDYLDRQRKDRESQRQKDDEDRPLLGLVGDTVDKNINAAKLGAAEGAGNLYGVDYGNKLTGALPAVLPDIVNRNENDLTNPVNQLEATHKLLQQSKALAEKQNTAGKPVTALTEQDLQKMGLLTPNTDYYQHLIDTARNGIKANKEASQQAFKEAPLPYVAANLAAAVPAYGVANNAMSGVAGDAQGIANFAPLSENTLVQKLPEKARNIIGSDLVNNAFQGSKMGALAGLDKNINGEGSGDLPTDIGNSALKYGTVAGGLTLGQILAKKAVGNNYKFPAETGDSYNNENVKQHAKETASDFIDTVNSSMNNSKNTAAESLKNAAAQGSTVDLTDRIKGINNVIASKDQWLPESQEDVVKIKEFIQNFKTQYPDLKNVPVDTAQKFLKQMNELGPFKNIIKNPDYKAGIGSEAKALSEQIKPEVDQFGSYSDEKAGQSNLLNTMNSVGVDLKAKNLPIMESERNKELANKLTSNIMGGKIDQNDFLERSANTFPEVAESANSITDASDFAKGLADSNATEKVGGIPGLPSLAKKVISLVPNTLANVAGKATNALNDLGINGTDQVLQSAGGHASSLPEKYQTQPISTFPSIQPKEGPPLKNHLNISPAVSDYVERNKAQTTSSQDFQKLNESTPEQLTDLANKIKNHPSLAGQSENGSALDQLTGPLMKAAEAPESTRSALLWGIYSQPAFQMFLRQNGSDK